MLHKQPIMIKTTISPATASSITIKAVISAQFSGSICVFFSFYAIRRLSFISLEHFFTTHKCLQEIQNKKKIMEMELKLQETLKIVVACAYRKG